MVVVERRVQYRLLNLLSIVHLVLVYVIAVYDVGAERTQKMLKIGRKYLTWIQNSVLEGELTQVQLDQMVDEMLQVMEIGYDSLILFKNRDVKWMDKEVIGTERGSTDQFL